MEYDKLRKELLGALIGLAKTCGNNPKTENTERVIIEGLVAVHTQSFGEEMLTKKLEKVRQEKHTIAPNCSTCAAPCGNTSEYNIDLLDEEEEHCRVLKELEMVTYRLDVQTLEELRLEITEQKQIINSLK